MSILLHKIDIDGLVQESPKNNLHVDDGFPSSL